MKRLLSIEFQKLWKNTASKVLIISYFVLLSFIALIASIKFPIGGQEFRIADQGIFNFPFIWHFNTYIAAILKIFLAVVIVSMTANEYTYGTLKQNLIDGLSKKEFIISKLLTVGIFAFGSTLFITIVSLILGLSFSSYNELAIIVMDSDYLLAYCIKLLAFFSFCLFLGVLVKRSAFALGFLILWYFVEKIIYGLLKWKFFKNTDVADYICQFLPLESMSNLILNPFLRMSFVKTLEEQAGYVNNTDYSVNYGQLAIVVGWTVLFAFFSYKLIKKRDL